VRFHGFDQILAGFGEGVGGRKGCDGEVGRFRAQGKCGRPSTVIPGREKRPSWRDIGACGEKEVSEPVGVVGHTPVDDLGGGADGGKRDAMRFIGDNPRGGGVLGGRKNVGQQLIGLEVIGGGRAEANVTVSPRGGGVFERLGKGQRVQQLAFREDLRKRDGGQARGLNFIPGLGERFLGGVPELSGPVQEFSVERPTGVEKGGDGADFQAGLPSQGSYWR